jgi:hypothetical protein
MWLSKIALIVFSLIVLSVAAMVCVHFLIKLLDHLGWFGWQRRGCEPDLQVRKKTPSASDSGKSDAA